jgi:hypothetical protein
MSILARALRFIGTAWLWAAGLLIVFSHIVVLQVDGFWALMNLLNPWNIASMLTLDLTMAPGLLLHMAADQLTMSPTSSEHGSAIVPSYFSSADRSHAAAVALVEGLRTEHPAML